MNPGLCIEAFWGDEFKPERSGGRSLWLGPASNVLARREALLLEPKLIGGSRGHIAEDGVSGFSAW